MGFVALHAEKQDTSIAQSLMHLKHQADCMMHTNALELIAAGGAPQAITAVVCAAVLQVTT